MNMVAPPRCFQCGNDEIDVVPIRKGALEKHICDECFDEFIPDLVLDEWTDPQNRLGTKRWLIADARIQFIHDARAHDDFMTRYPLLIGDMEFAQQCHVYTETFFMFQRFLSTADIDRSLVLKAENFRTEIEDAQFPLHEMMHRVFGDADEVAPFRDAVVEKLASHLGILFGRHHHALQLLG